MSWYKILSMNPADVRKTMQAFEKEQETKRENYK